jgi:hypothetical protein
MTSLASVAATEIDRDTEIREQRRGIRQRKRSQRKGKRKRGRRKLTRSPNIREGLSLMELRWLGLLSLTEELEKVKVERFSFTIGIL